VCLMNYVRAELLQRVRNVFRKYLTWLPVLFLLIFMLGCGSRKPPNVLFITLDTTRPDHLGAYGAAQAVTPAIDSLAEHGILFEKAYCSCPMTLPSHTTMFTGLNPPEHGVHVNGENMLNLSFTTLAEKLRTAGYHTSAFVAAFVLNHRFGLDQGFDIYNDELKGGAYSDVDIYRFRSGDQIADAAIKWLEQAEEPFFCWVHFFDPHVPRDPHRELFTFMDIQVDRLLTVLRERGLGERTIIVAVGDHGEGLGDHGEDMHGYMVYNSTMHVPLIFSWPGHLSEGAHIEALASLADLYPTLLDLLHLSGGEEVSGQSLAPALMGRQMDHPAVYGESELGYRTRGWSPLYSITTEKWKYVRTTKPELYELQNDPCEQTNLVTIRKDEAEDLEWKLSEIEAKMSEFKAKQTLLSEDDRQALESLGYAAPRPRTETSSSKVLPDMKDVIELGVNQVIRARDLIREGNGVDAVPLLAEVIKQFPEELDYQDYYAEALMVAGRNTEAVAVYEKILREDPDRPETYSGLGMICFKTGDYEGAVSHYRRVVEQDETSASAYCNMGVALNKLDRPDEAIDNLRTALRIRPDFVKAHYNLGLVLYGQGETEKAVGQWEKVLAIDPDNAPARAMLHKAKAPQ